jgi:hypothetical protein
MNDPTFLIQIDDPMGAKGRVIYVTTWGTSAFKQHAKEYDLPNAASGIVEFFRMRNIHGITYPSGRIIQSGTGRVEQEFGADAVRSISGIFLSFYRGDCGQYPAPCSVCGRLMPNPEDLTGPSHDDCRHNEWIKKYKFKKDLFVSLGIRVNGGYRTINGYLVSFDYPTVWVREKGTGQFWHTNHCGNVLPYIDQSHLEPKQLTIKF